MVGFTARSPEDILSEIRCFFAEIPKETLAAVENKWIPRLDWIIEHNGERYRID
jgi:hypothetical protein